MIEAHQRDVMASDGIAAALETLDARSRRIVEERWLKVNDDGSGGLTLHDLAAEYGVSAERIRQIEVAAMKKMKTALAAYAWDAGELHLDEAYKAALPEFHARKALLGPGDLPCVLDVEATGGQSAATIVATASRTAGNRSAILRRRCGSANCSGGTARTWSPGEAATGSAGGSDGSVACS